MKIRVMNKHLKAVLRLISIVRDSKTHGFDMVLNNIPFSRDSENSLCGMSQWAYGSSFRYSIVLTLLINLCIELN